MSYDDWLEQPRVDADDDARREEQVDEFLGGEYDEACATRNGYERAAGLRHMDASDVIDWITGRDDYTLLLRAVILAAHDPRSRHTVETAVAAMIDAGRQAYIDEPRNRERARQIMQDAGRD